MSAPKLEGVLAPITTPFDPVTGDVAAEPLRKNAERLLGAGLDGILGAGSTGEAPLLSNEEFRLVVATLRAAVPRDRLLFAGTGAESTRAAIALSRAAAAEGADAVLVRPPGYFGAQAVNGLVDYYRAIADASPVPVLVYNMPKFTHQPIAPAVVAELARHPRIVGAKDSSGDVKNLAAYREAAPRWALFVGSASLFHAALELGCQGGVLGVACFAPRRCADLLAAHRAGKRDVAETLQRTLTTLDKEIVSKSGPAGVKAAMDAAGYFGGDVRAPLVPLPDAERARLAQLVA
ncbi:MAG TPA: dihydrodipicolinate synthase family protein [Gemmatimonadales bacterium]|nr:dihydrodipicolinate synthase family protein [Gemmatimonadales bacterium]